MVRFVKMCQNCQKLLRLSKIIKIVRNCQDWWKWSKFSKKIVNIVEHYQNWQKLSKFSKIFKNFQKFSKIVKNCQKLSKLSKIVKTLKNCQKCQNSQKLSKLSKIVKMLVRSCFLITLIKCLKGHKSLGSLFVCQLVKSSVSEWVSQWVTRSPIELLWTAKKLREVCNHQHSCFFNKFQTAFDLPPLYWKQCHGFIRFSGNLIPKKRRWYFMTVHLISPLMLPSWALSSPPAPFKFHHTPTATNVAPFTPDTPRSISFAP